VLNTLRDAGVRVTLYPRRASGWQLHSKYLLVDAPYAGSSGHQHLVFTGSHNYTGGALTANDENVLRVDDGAVFNAFLADWVRVRAAAARP
jgi:phosphatidylserine/phosphatidylglycerophosphate/cardiolipin synthase-like enzyme